MTLIRASRTFSRKREKAARLYTRGVAMPSTDRGVHSFGHELRACQLDAIRVSETQVPRSLALDTHQHEPGQILFLLEGGFSDRSATGDEWLRPGMVRWRRPGLPHANVFDAEDDTVVLLISIDERRWSSVSDSHPIVAPVAWRKLVCEMQRELRRSDDASLLALEGLSLLLASRLTRGTLLERDDREPAWLADALAYIHSSFSHRITVASVAARVGVHRSTLAAAFRRFRGTTIAELIRELRIRHVMGLLSRTHIPLDELAQQSGFCDQSHMSRLFRRATGMTPREYRMSSGA